MAQIFQFTLSGVSNQLQVGKGGPWFVNSGSFLAVMAADQSALAAIQVGAPSAASDAATKSYVDNTITSTITTDQLVSLTQWTKGGSTSASVPSTSAAAGTVAASGWFRDPSGNIRNWAFIQLSAGANVSLTFPLTFPTAVLGFHAINVGGVTGASASTATPTLVAASNSSASFTINNYGLLATTSPFYVEVTGN